MTKLAVPTPDPVRRTVLAVPGSSDRFLAKARGLSADAVFLDLEDAVAPAAKVRRGLGSADRHCAGQRLEHSMDLCRCD